MIKGTTFIYLFFQLRQLSFFCHTDGVREEEKVPLSNGKRSALGVELFT